MPNWLLNIAIAINITWSRLTLRRRLLSAARDVKGNQLRLLRRILRDNRETEFGRKYEFAKINSIEEFRRSVPVNRYENLEKYILAQQGGAAGLTDRPPVYFARTSGTTGRYKDIPLTKDGIHMIKQAQKQLAISLWKATNFFDGKVLGFASPGIEGRLANGTPFGSTSGVTYSSLSKVIATKFAVPKEAYNVSDMEAKYQIYALAALAHGDITGMVSANPSSMLKVCSLIQSDPSKLLAALIEGDSRGLLPEARKIASLIGARADQHRLKRIAELKRSGSPLTPDIIWSKLSAIATWTGGSVGLALKELMEYLPGSVRVVEYGYGASEFMGSMNVDAQKNICLPSLIDVVFEFVEREEWEEGQANFLNLEEIKNGREYYIFATTSSGLYRYDINDVIRATRGIADCPGLEFICKGKGVTNITGEKLCEDQVIAAISKAFATCNIIASNYMILANVKMAQYHLIAEFSQTADLSALAKIAERELCAANSEYEDKRASGRLKPLRVSRLKSGAVEAFKRKRVSEGVRESQYKPTILGYWADFECFFANWLADVAL